MKMSAVDRPIVASYTPHYPYETSGKSLLAREKLERSLQSRAALQSASYQTIHYRSNRLHGHSHPAVVSNTQPFLSLTPSGVHTGSSNRRLRHHTSVPVARRFNEYENQVLPYMTSVATFVTSDNVMGTSAVMSPTPPATHRSLPITRPHFQYKHSRNVLNNRKDSAKPSAKTLFDRQLAFKPPTPPVSQSKKTSDVKCESARIYRAHLQSYFGPRRGDVNMVGRKMAPVLRVLPATSGVKPTRVSRSEFAKDLAKSTDESELMSQKRVRFSDQMGYPLVRNMTPNYRRKHAYILRWLETAGRSAQTLV